MCGYPVFPALCVEDVFSPVFVFFHIVKYQMTIYFGVLVFGDIYFCGSTILFLLLQLYNIQKLPSLQQTKITVENHNWTQCRGQWIVESPAPADTSVSQLLRVWLRENHEQGGRDSKSQKPGSLLCDCLSYKWCYK